MLKRFLSIFLVFSMFICCSINFCSAQNSHCDKKFYNCDTGFLLPCENTDTKITKFFMPRDYLEAICTESKGEKFKRLSKSFFDFLKDTIVPCLNSALPVVTGIIGAVSGVPTKVDLSKTNKPSGKLRTELYGHEVCTALLAASNLRNGCSLVYSTKSGQLSDKSVFSDIYSLEKADC